MSVINSTLSRENVVVQEDAKLSYSEPMERHLPSRRRPSKKFITSASTVEGSHGRDVRVGAVDIPEMERQNMSGAEGEQCALDHFWGLVANQEEQAEATAAMDTEDRRSQAVRAQIKKEERYTMWEQEDMRTRETRTAMRQYLEEAARREYLEDFYSAPSADFAINYQWPTSAYLTKSQLGQRQGQNGDVLSSGQKDEDAVATDNITRLRTNSSHENALFSRKGDDSTAPTLSSTQKSAFTRHNDWSSTGAASDSSSTGPFHSLRGRKTHRLIHVEDCFVPPRYVTEPSTQHGLVSQEVLLSLKLISGKEAATDTAWLTAGVDADAAGRVKAVHLPPMPRSPNWRTPETTTMAASDGEPATRRRKDLAFTRESLTLKPGAPGQPLAPSFQRKFNARQAMWSQEAELEAEGRAQKEPWRADDFMRHGGGQHGGNPRGLGHHVGDGFRCQRSEAGGHHGVEEFRGTRRRRRKRRLGTDEVAVAMELIPAAEERLLSQIYSLLDSRNRGGVQLDEVLFHMTENAQVKFLLRKVTLWTLIKTRRWEWLDELFAAQPGRTLTLPALLAFSRGLHREVGVPRKHLRLVGAQRDEDSVRNDVRSRRLLPENFHVGQNVEALFMKGFVWYRAWIVKCREDQTFDVRYIRPGSTSDNVLTSSPGGTLEDQSKEERPEVVTPVSQTLGSEEVWGKAEVVRSKCAVQRVLGQNHQACQDMSDSDAAAEARWRATCESVKRFIGTVPDLGETEEQLLNKAFDAMVELTCESKLSKDGGYSAVDVIEPRRPLTGASSNDQSVGGSNTRYDGVPARNNNDGIPSWAREATMGVQNQAVHHLSTSELDGSGDKTKQKSYTSAPDRVSAGEIVRLLHGGAIEEYRKASPALSAARLYRDFAEGLMFSAEADTGNYDISAGGALSFDSDRRRFPDNTNVQSERRAQCDGDEAKAGGRYKGVSKEEFCEYFEAVTDLVDVNSLSLAPRGHEGSPRVSAACA